MKSLLRPLNLLCAVLLILLIQMACSLSSKAGPESQPPTQASLLPTSETNVQPVEAAQLFERRLMVVEWPPAIRLGDSDVVRFSLVMDEQGRITPTSEISGHQVGGEPVQIPDLYETHNLVIVARLDMAGMEVSPNGEVSQTLRPGRAVTFYWSLSPHRVGEYRGTLWVYLDLVPKAGGEMQQQPLLARLLEIEGRSVLGMSAGITRWAGAVGTVASAVLGFPFLEKVLKSIWERIRKRTGSMIK